MQRVFLLQTDMGHPDPWDDSVNLANVGVSPGLGNTNNSNQFKNRISFFQRADNRFSLSSSYYPDYDLILKKPFSMHDPKTEVPISFNQIADILDKKPSWIANGLTAKVVLMGCVMQPTENTPLSQQNVIENSTYYIRYNERIVDVINNKDIDNARMIPWFFCYKTDDLPLYYIVLNPHAVQCIDDIDGDYGDNKVYTIGNHLKNLSDIVFTPKLSRNARLIGEHNIMVRGGKFTVQPFSSWFVQTHLPEFFKEAKVKVDTNFDYTWEDGKIVINTLNKQKGYLILRWNTSTGMDFIFHTSKNRFFKDYVVDVVE